MSVRLSVCRSRRSAAGRRRAVAPRTSRPPGSWAASAASPRTRWIDARRRVPASVRVSVPSGKSKAASPTRPGGRAPAGRQWSRPAIIRWITTKRSPPAPGRSACPGDAAPRPSGPPPPNGRVDRAQHEGARQANPLQPLAEDPRLEGRQVRDDVRQLRHGVLETRARRGGRRPGRGEPGSSGRPRTSARPRPCPARALPGVGRPAPRGLRERAPGHSGARRRGRDQRGSGTRGAARRRPAGSARWGRARWRRSRPPPARPPTAWLQDLGAPPCRRVTSSRGRRRGRPASCRGSPRGRPAGSPRRAA